MQSKEFISLAKKSFRHLRKGESVFVKDLANDSGISWPTTKSVVDELKAMGYLKETTEKNLIINPDFKDEYFAGVYITNNSISISIIDFLGNEIHFETQNFDERKSVFTILKEKLSLLKGIKAISICSDNILIDSNGDAMIPDTLFIDCCLIREFLPKDMKIYLEKTYITNSFKCFEDDELKDEELNIVMSFYEENCYYTIWKNGEIIQKRKYPEKIKNADSLYADLIIPTCKLINPNNIIFVISSEDDFEMMQAKSFEWSSKIYYLNNTFDNVYEGNKNTQLIARKYLHPSESAGLYAMYRYYGWAK